MPALLPLSRAALAPTQRHHAVVASVGVAFALLWVPRLDAQRPVTRADAIAAAMDSAPRLRLARADSSTARAALAVAKQFENPTIGALYSKSAPQAHFTLDVPLDMPGLRRLRIGAAEAGLGAASHRYVFAREAIAFGVDTSYTMALAATRRAQLSHRSARDADSLLSLAQFRRDAGDASMLDVEISQLFAGQAGNLSASDSLAAITAVLAVQAAMGLPATTPSIVLTDSLLLEATRPMSSATGPREAERSVLLTASEEDLRAADLVLQFERRRVLAPPVLSLGVETRNPGGAGGALPLIGLSLPLPLFHRNAATTDVARVAVDRARAQLALARIELTAALAQAQREAVNAYMRADRSARLVSSADRVAALSLLAYREGASTLVSVLESQRSARETLSQYLVDVALARNTAALVRLLTLSVASPP